MFFVALAQANDGPSGPELVWAPVLEVRGRISAEGDPFPRSRTVGQAARMGLQVSRGILSARVSLQEVRSWTGDRDSGLTGDGTFAPELAEGWARFDTVLSPNIGARLTIGRQAIVMNEGRLIGRREWDLEGQFLDALRFELEARPISFELVNARRFEPTGPDPFSFGVTALRLGIGRGGGASNGQFDLLSVVDARNTAQLTSTTGGFGTVTTGRLSGTAEAYFQQNPEGNATLASGRIGYVIGRNRAWALHGGYSAASGDPGTPGGIATFQPVLGDTHDTFGLLDLILPGDDPRGVSDLTVGAEVIAGQRLTVCLSAHRLASPMSGALYGYETDVALAWFVTPFATAELGVSQVAGGEQGPAGGGYLELRVAF